MTIDYNYHISDNTNYRSLSGLQSDYVNDGAHIATRIRI